MIDRCQTCKLPFRRWYHMFMPWKRTVRQFCRGVYCVEHAASFFASLGHMDVAAEMKDTYRF